MIYWNMLSLPWNGWPGHLTRLKHRLLPIWGLWKRPVYGSTENFCDSFWYKKEAWDIASFLLGIYFCVLSFLIWDQVMLGSLKTSGSVIWHLFYIPFHPPFSSNTTHSTSLIDDWQTMPYILLSATPWMMSSSSVLNFKISRSSSLKSNSYS